MNNNSENKIKGKKVNQNLSVRVLLRNSSLVFSEGFMALMNSASRVSNLGREWEVARIDTFLSKFSKV